MISESFAFGYIPRREEKLLPKTIVKFIITLKSGRRRWIVARKEDTNCTILQLRCCIIVIELFMKSCLDENKLYIQCYFLFQRCSVYLRSGAALPLFVDGCCKMFVSLIKETIFACEF